MKKRMNRRITGGCILILLLTSAVLFFLKGGHAGDDWSEEDGEAGHVVLEYRWKEGDAPISVRYVPGTGEFYLYDGYRQVCRIKDMGLTEGILSMDGEAADASGFEECFAEHEEGLILYRDSLPQTVRAVRWLENDGAVRLYSVTCGDYADLYYRYKGKQYRLFLCPADKEAVVCFAPLETEISTPDRKEILRRLKSGE